MIVRRNEVLTIANALTFVRVPLAVLLWLRPADLVWTGSIVALAALTDVLDGPLARRRRKRLETRPSVGGSFGGFLDPACDKIFVVSVLALAYVELRPPFAVVLLVGTREILQLPLLLIWLLVPSLRRRYVPEMHARIWGKAATVGQFAAIVVLVLGLPYLWPVSAVTAVLGVAAPLGYLNHTLATPRRPTGADAQRHGDTIL